MSPLEQYPSMSATVVTAQNVQGGEKFLNTGFESDITNWESNTALGTYAQATLSRQGSAHGGSWCLQAAWPAAAGKKSVLNHVSVPTIQGVAYRFQGYYYIPVGSPNVRPVVIFVSGGADLTVKGAWTYFSWDFVASGDYAYFGCETTVNADGGSMKLDDVSLKLTAAPYAVRTDGSVTSAPAAALNAGAFAVGQRVTVDVRNPLWPLIQGEETAPE